MRGIADFPSAPAWCSACSAAAGAERATHETVCRRFDVAAAKKTLLALRRNRLIAATAGRNSSLNGVSNLDNTLRHARFWIGWECPYLAGYGHRTVPERKQPF
jgi:hypothetical protein